MKLIFIPIAIILAFQATSLFYAAQERHIYHTSLSSWSHLFSADLTNCFKCDEQLRHIIVAFMYAAAYLLLVNEAVWPAVVSQLVWLALESNLCHDTSLSNLRNFAIQLLIFFILCSNLKCCLKECPMSCARPASPGISAPSSEPITQPSTRK